MLVRTESFPCVQSLKEEGIAYETFDRLYEHSRNYDTLTKKIVAQVLPAALFLRVSFCNR